MHVCRFYTRKRVGPTSRKKTWMILVDTCRCGQVKPIEDLTPAQASWVQRWNLRFPND
jgi:hypothetical protein